MFLLSPLTRGTSPVDWCEGNYKFSPVIAEYYNTLSSFVFVVLPVILFKLFHQYANIVNKGIYIVLLLFAVVGFSSAYFHATLSLVGQLLDELSILWLMATCFALWIPRKYCGTNNDNRRKFRCLIFSLCSLFTVLSLVYPWINAFALMLLAIPTFTFIGLEVKNCSNARVKRLGKRSSIIWLIGLVFWLCDRFLCKIFIPFDCLHSLWHIFAALTAYTLCIVSAYIDAQNELDKAQVPSLMYWPNDHYEIGLPYVHINNRLVKQTN